MSTKRKLSVLVTPLALLLTGCSSGPPPLDNGVTGSTTICLPATPALTWSTMRSRATMIGLDYYIVHEPVVIDSVEPADGTGLTITKAAFVKGGGVGVGSFYGDIAYTAGAASWAARINMPQAHLPLSASDNEADQWELTVGVIPGNAGGSASGVKVSYHDLVGHRFTAIGRNGFALWPQEARCSQLDSAAESSGAPTG